MSVQATKRLAKELRQLEAQPVPYVQARPAEDNILDWHYVITGPPNTPYEGGEYHGRVTFPPEYPFKPPRIKMCTPSGRFECNKRLCLSMSDFHEESWNPSWSVATILTGLLSFMTGEEPTTGSIVTSETTKRRLAKESRATNRANGVFRRVFPELACQPVTLPTKASDTQLGHRDANFAPGSEPSAQGTDGKGIEQGGLDASDLKSSSTNANHVASGTQRTTDNAVLDPEDKIRAELAERAKQAETGPASTTPSATLVALFVAILATLYYLL